MHLNIQKNVIFISTLSLFEIRPPISLSVNFFPGGRISNELKVV